MPTKRILLLEDDPALSDLLEDAFSDEGYTVQRCDSFQELLRAAKGGEADLAVADYWGTSQATLGQAEQAEIRQLGQAIPLILLTGRAWATTTSADAVRAAVIVPKPFDVFALLDTVNRVAAGSA